MSELRTGPTSDNELTWLNNRAAYWIAKGDGLDNHFHAYGVMRLIDRLAAAESRISHLEAALREIAEADEQVQHLHRYDENDDGEEIDTSDECALCNALESALAALYTPKEHQ